MEACMPESQILILFILLQVATCRGEADRRTSQLQRFVELLRSRAVNWAQIGGALGISRQSAWERFT
jgi:hypothetical protein